MQIQRLFETVHLLLNRRRTTARELAERFDVSVRTIFRDLEVLSLAGIPVYTTQGRGGGLALLDNFTLDKTVVSEEEQNQILLALQSVAGAGGAEGLLGKLGALFDKEGADWIRVDFARWGHGSSDSPKFEVLKAAVVDRRTLAFDYFNAMGESSERKAWPLRLVFKSKSWYLQAFCLTKNDHRTFKINRMRDIRILGDKALDEEFARRDFKTPELESPGPAHEKLCRLRLLFQPQAAFRVFDEFKDADVTRNPGGTLLVSARLPDDEWLPGYLLSFGTWLTVLEPDRVRRSLGELVERLSARYQGEG
ncbi:MAG: YafY family transcriptional regulator [Deltaproteobacteria bacterium]|jgi:predicted DNA-binding transcriptional regulator YafY|nr:YafY family transcriptional regulator [Deltaproteobacteria bacterium]